MARTPTHPPLNVFLNSRLVGVLRRASSGAIDFQYDDSWLAWQHALPISLSMPLREDRYIGEPVAAVFENLLPDNNDIRRHLAERVGAEGTDAYQLLSVIGRDCVGALQFLPDGKEPDPPGAINAKPVSDEEIERIVTDLKRNPLGLDHDDEFRISIAGAQEKTALLFWKGGWHIPHGTTATTHIFKPQIGHLPNGIDLSNSVENEHLCLRLADELGLPTANSEIRDFGSKRVLVVERFDRHWTPEGRLLRLPQEDSCQALSVPPARKYESHGGPGMPRIMELLKGSDDPEEDQRAFFKAIILFWLLGATDGHAKNFSVFLQPGGRYRLTPLYDIISAQPSADSGQITKNKLKLAMAVGEKRHYGIESIAPRHFIQSAKLCRYSAQEVDKILAQLADDAHVAFQRVRTSLPPNFPELVLSSFSRALENRVHQIRLHQKLS